MALGNLPSVATHEGVVMRWILETERVRLREFGLEDAPGLHRLNSHPEVMRFTGEPPWKSVEEAERRILSYPDYREIGYGRWACIDRDTGALLGFNGLKYLPELDETDIGYRFLPEFWGRGLATETSHAVLAHGFDSIGLDRIIGLVLPDNTGSIRVLEKLGLALEESFEDEEGRTVRRYAISRDAWIRRSA